MEDIFSVSVEGGDQVGKGDAVKNISEKLASEGFDVCVVSFPCYATPVGYAVREVLKKDLFEDLGLDKEEAVSSKMALFALNRLEVLNCIMQEESNYIYVFDRSPFSAALTIAYAVAQGFPRDSVNMLVKKALSLDAFFRKNLNTDNCVIKLSHESNTWSRSREDGDLHERMDVQELSGSIYSVFSEISGGNWLEVTTKDSNGWRARSEILNRCIEFVRPKLNVSPQGDSKAPEYLSVGESINRLYNGAVVRQRDLDLFLESVRVNDKGEMFKASEVIVMDTVSSVKEIKWYNEDIRMAVGEIIDSHDSILLLLERLYGEEFVVKFLKSVQNE